MVIWWGREEEEGGEWYYVVVCLSHLAIDRASLSIRSTARQGGGVGWGGGILDLTLLLDPDQVTEFLREGTGGGWRRGRMDGRRTVPTLPVNGGSLPFALMLRSSMTCSRRRGFVR